MLTNLLKKIPIYAVFALFSMNVWAEAVLTYDGKLSVPHLRYEADAQNAQSLWANFEYVSTTEDGALVLKLTDYGASDATAVSAQAVISAERTLHIPELRYTNATGSTSNWWATLAYHGTAADGSVLVRLQEFGELGQMISGQVSSGFNALSTRQARSEGNHGSMSHATLIFYDADWVELARFEEATDANGRYSVTIPEGEVTYLEVEGGYFDPAATRASEGVISVLCLPAEMETCNATAYSSLVMRLAEAQEGENWTVRIAQAKALIEKVLRITEDPAFTTIPNWSEIFDDSFFQKWIGENGSNFSFWFDNLAIDMLDGYLDGESNQKAFIGYTVRPNFTASIFGSGALQSSDNVIAVDNRADRSSDMFFETYLPADTEVELTATPADNYQILYWTGCHYVSADKARCGLLTDGESDNVQVTFGVIEPEVVSNVFDLTAATHEVNGDVYLLSADSTDTETQETLAGIVAGDYIVSANGAGFLRQVTAVEQLSIAQYQFTTTSALLEDVIVHGTVALNQTVDMDQVESVIVNDFDSNTQTRSARQQRRAQEAMSYFQQLPLGSDELVPSGTNGVYLKRADSKDKVTIVFGLPENSRVARMSFEEKESISLVIYDADRNRETKGDQVRLKGELTIKITPDIGFDFSWGDLKSMKFIVEVESQEKITFEGDFSGLIGKISTPTYNTKEGYYKSVLLQNEGKKLKILTFKLKTFLFTFGIVPVTVAPSIDINAEIGATAGVKSSITLQLDQHVKAGFQYNDESNDPWNYINAFNHNEKIDFKPAEVTAIIKAGLSIEPVLAVYEVFKLAAYAKVAGNLDFTVSPNFDEPKECGFKAETKIFAELDVGVKFGTEAGKLGVFKFKNFIPDLEASFSIYKKTFPFFASQALLGESERCTVLSPAKLGIDGPFISEVLSQKNNKPVLEHKYTVSNEGHQDLDWSVELAEISNEITFIDADGTAKGKIVKKGLKSDQTYDFTVRIETTNLQPSNSKLLDLFNFAADLSDNRIDFTALWVPVYSNQMVFKNDTDAKTFSSGVFEQFEGEFDKGDTKLNINISLPQPPLPSAPELLFAMPVSSTMVRLGWKYDSFDSNTTEDIKGLTVHFTDLTTGEKSQRDIYGIVRADSETESGFQESFRRIINELKPDTSYSVAVELFGVNRWSGMSNALEVRTKLEPEVTVPIVLPIDPWESDKSFFPRPFEVSATEADGTPLTAFTINVVQQPAHGTLAVEDQTIIYDLVDRDFLGEDSFTFSVTNAAGMVSEASTVALNIVKDNTSTSPGFGGTSQLNDTGITWGGEYPDGNNDTCTGETISAQDCSHGRDVTHNDDSDGHAGFSFTRHTVGSDQCVQDNVTGLTWEVKQGGNGTRGDEGLHDADDRYNWYNTNPNTNGGADGNADDDGNICYGYDANNPASYCNTEAYVARVNAEGYCGFKDWRMPNREELRSIVDYGRRNPAIDVTYFPNTQSSSYWSGSPVSGFSAYAWNVYFGYGYDYSGSRTIFRHVRLVRGGQ